jgi:tetratricopeptide (TPR) repeat protein
MQMTYKKMRIYFFFIPVVFLIVSCNTNSSNENDFERGNRKADSISIKLNAPELKAVNSELLNAPNNADLYQKRSIVYLRLKQFEEAINDSKRAIRIDSLQAKYYITLADIYFAQNSTRLAKELLEITTTKFPENTEAHLKLAELYYLVQRYQEAIEFANKALKINENIAKAYFIKGSVYRESGDTTRAISSLETVVEQDKNYADAYFDLGVLYASRKNPIALEYYNNVLRIDPARAPARYARAKLLQDLGKIDDAIKEYEAILADNANCDDCFYNMGALYLEVKKNPKKALESFNKALEINRSFLAAYLARGYTYSVLNDKTSAKADYNMCLQLQPNYEPAIQGLNEL